MDPRGQEARRHHQEAIRASSHHRAERDRLVRELSEDGYGYTPIARMVGCSRELVRLIIKGENRL